jgi:ParB family transcriptional regulator, chromosome partitioning protein
MERQPAGLSEVGLEHLEVSPLRPAGVSLTPSRTLLARIREVGVVTPLVVRTVRLNRYEILSDPKVWVAAGRLGIQRIPILVLDDLSEARAQRIVALHYTDSNRNAMLEAEEIADLLAEQSGPEWGRVTRLAQRLGLRRTYVAHALRLLTLPDSIQDQVRNGLLSAGHARALVTLPSRPQQRLLREIRLEQLSVRETEQRASEMRDSSRLAKLETSSDPDIRRLEADMTALIGSPFELRGGKLVIDYFGDLDVLQGLLLQLGYTVK